MESNNPSQSAASIGALIEHHLALARALLLSGASAEARGHLRSSEQVYLRLGRRLMVRQREGSANNDQDAEPEECVLAENNSASQTEVLKTAIASLHLEIAMLSHTPVVLNSQEEAGALRERFTEELLRMSSRRSSAIFLGDDWKFSNPLAIGVRSQFLLTYQARRKT